MAPRDTDRFSLVALALIALSGCAHQRLYMADCDHGDCSDCATCDSDSCTSCGKNANGPAARLFKQIACRGGCGEVYVGEWTSDPPDCCDPCDECGRYTGAQACCDERPRDQVSMAVLGTTTGPKCVTPEPPVSYAEQMAQSVGRGVQTYQGYPVKRGQVSSYSVTSETSPLPIPGGRNQTRVARAPARTPDPQRRAQKQTFPFPKLTVPNGDRLLR